MPWITNSLTSIVLSPLVGCLVGSSHVLLGSGSDYGCVEYKWGYMRWSYICFAFSVGRSWTSVNHWKFPTTTNKNLQMLVAASEDWSWWGPLSGWLDLVGFLWTGYPFHEKSKQILIIKDGSFPQVQLPPIVVVHFSSLFFVACQGRGNFPPFAYCCSAWLCHASHTGYDRLERMDEWWERLEEGRDETGAIRKSFSSWKVTWPLLIIASIWEEDLTARALGMEGWRDGDPISTTSPQ